MRPLLLAALVLLASACDRPCEPGEQRACSCADGGRLGLETCADSGEVFGACDCSEAACTPSAALACVAHPDSAPALQHRLHGVDACGNVDPVTARVCACPCAEGGATCPGWEVPPAMVVPAACADASGCLLAEDVHCERTGPAEWSHGLRLTNRCDHPIRCYVFRYESRNYGAGPGATMTWVSRSFVGPPRIPALAPGEVLFGRSLYGGDAACRAEWDAFAASEFHYAACVRADDDPAACLPPIGDGELPAEVLPICGGR